MRNVLLLGALVCAAGVFACSDASSPTTSSGVGGTGASTSVGAGGTSGSGGSGGSLSFGADYPMPPGVGTGPDVYVATNGDDANDGHSLDAPLRTLDKAVEVAEPGSIVYARAGTYDGFTVSDGAFGTPEKWILLRNYMEEVVTVRGTGSGPTIYFYADSCDESNDLVNGDCAKAYWRIEGLSLQGSPDGGDDGNVIKIDTPQVQIVKNKLCCSNADIIKNVRTADDTKIVGNEIWQDPSVVTPGSNAQGIDITGADRLLVAGNYLHDLTDTAMYAKGNARQTTFESNLVENAGLAGEGNGIMCGQSTDADRLVDGNYETYDCLIRNNIVMHVAGACLAIGSSQNAKVYNNTCFDTATAIHAALFLTNESEVEQPSTNVEIRGNVIYQTTGPRIFTDTDELGMTDWSTLVVADNVYFVAGSEPVFTLKSTTIYDGGSFDEWQTAFSGLTGNGDSSRAVDPAFVDESAFELGKGSPAIDAVDCVVSSDYDGTPRPAGARCDVGAQEATP